MAALLRLARVVAPIAFKFLGGVLPDFGSPTRLRSPSKLALVSPIAREFADFRAIQEEDVPPSETLIRAAREGNCPLLANVLASGECDPDTTDYNGYHALLT